MSTPPWRWPIFPPGRGAGDSAPYLSQAPGSDRHGVNVFIHGRPAPAPARANWRALAAALGCELFEIAGGLLRPPELVRPTPRTVAVRRGRGGPAARHFSRRVVLQHGGSLLRINPREAQIGNLPGVALAGGRWHAWRRSTPRLPAAR